MATHLSFLIQQSIEQLEKLSEFLVGEVPSNSRSRAALPPDKRVSKEAVLTISVLLPKLHAVQSVHTRPKFDE